MNNDQTTTENNPSTFMNCPSLKITETTDFDVVVVGIPVDSGATFRRGQNLGPKAIRDMSVAGGIQANEGLLEPVDVFDYNKQRKLKTNSLRMGDIGNVVVPQGDAEKTNQNIINTLQKIRNTSLPIVLGGDHSITYSSFIGCKKSIENSEYSSRLGILHFDAHTDTEKSFPNFPRVHHGNPFSELINEGYLSGEQMVTIGVRGYESLKWVELARQNDIKHYSMKDIYETGLTQILNQSLDRLNQVCDFIYVTFDIDCIDPSQAPGTGFPNFGGLYIQDVLKAFIECPFANIAAFDLVELCPGLDPSGITSFGAHEILYHFLLFGLSL